MAGAWGLRQVSWAFVGLGLGQDRRDFYLAKQLSEAGFTNGFLSSYNGFTRNLDDRGEPFSLNLLIGRVLVCICPALCSTIDPFPSCFCGIFL